MRLIWEERQTSRAEIARRLGLSRSTAGEVVGELLEMGLVIPAGMARPQGGRPPAMLEFNDAAGYCLGVEMGATHVSVALTDLRGRVLVWKNQPHPVRDDPVGTRALMAACCAACLAERPGSSRLLIGIGIAAPCPVDPAHPDRFSEIVLPAWGGRAGLRPLARRYEVPLFVDNDANLGALSECRWGVGRGIDDFTYVKLGTGVGSGHFLRGAIYRGATGVAGEIGHLAIDPHGKLCLCGLRGCLTTLVGTAALVARCTELLAQYPDSVLARTQPTIASIEDAALAGDPLGLRVAHEAADCLGIAIAGLLNILNPRLVILGGGLSRLGDVLLEPVREVIRNRALVTSRAATEVTTSNLGPQSIALGAATLVLDAALADARLIPVVRAWVASR
jgi:predicted NBD/HSP70 family sugar kinase